MPETIRVKVCIVGYRDWAFDIFKHLQFEDVAKLKSFGVEFNWVTFVGNNFDNESSFLIENPTEMGEFSNWLMNEDFDFIVFAGWSWIIKDEFINTYNCLCIHPSDINESRGGTPIQNQILSGADSAIVTLFKMTSKLDWGPILDKRKIRLDGYIPEILSRITDAGVVSIRSVIQDLLSGSEVRESDKILGAPGKLGKRRHIEDSEIKLSVIEKMSFDNIDRLARSLTGPYPRLCILECDPYETVFYVDSVVNLGNLQHSTNDNDKNHQYLSIKCKDANVMAVGKYGMKKNGTR